MIARILICDDNVTRAPRWKSLAEKHNPGADVRVVTGQQLADLVSAIGWEELRSRGGERKQTDAERESIELIEWAEVVIIDSDLSPAPKDLDAIPEEQRDRVAGALRNGYGDSVARQLRSYTRAGLLVVVNMFWARHRVRRVFDLTLMQSAGAFADLHVSAAELDDGELWDSKIAPTDAYRPWQRPSIPQQLATLARSTEAVTNLDANVFSALGLDRSSFAPLQLDVFGEVDAATATFKQLTESPMGFRYPSDSRDDAACRRMAASVVRRWLERVVVPGQNVLADAPHLYERFWQFVGTPLDDLGLWNSTSRMTWDDARTAPARAAVQDLLEPFLTRPVFDLEKARSAVRELPKSNGIAPPDYGFAEDSSSFHPRDELESYSADVPGPFPRRWIEKVNNVGYEPANRLLL